jgi:hypothetical protein
MRIERIGGAGDRLEIEVDADLRAHCPEAGMDFGEAGVVAKLGAHVGAAVETLGRDRRIELKGTPAHRDHSVVRLRERRLEPPFADVAPGTDDIADDFDVHLARFGFHFALQLWVPCI